MKRRINLGEPNEWIWAIVGIALVFLIFAILTGRIL